MLIAYAIENKQVKRENRGQYICRHFFRGSGRSSAAGIGGEPRMDIKGSWSWGKL